MQKNIMSTWKYYFVVILIGNFCIANCLERVIISGSAVQLQAYNVLVPGVLLVLVLAI